MSRPVFWLKESYSPVDERRHGFDRVVVREKTRFQDAMIADSSTLGRCLILDGELQSAQSDEYMYHEALVHPAMTLHTAPRDILILGGGEGATARELLRYPGVRQVTMVDIDGDVMLFCKRHLSRWHRGAFRDPRLALVIGDARAFVTLTKERYDLIISDLPTPDSPKSPLASLYSGAFYKKLRSRLKPNGVIVVQSGAGNAGGLYVRVARALGRLGLTTRPYMTYIPSFDEPWAFVMGSAAGDPRKCSAAQVDRRLGRLKGQLKFYDGESHEGLFRIPKPLRMK